MSSNLSDIRKLYLNLLFNASNLLNTFYIPCVQQVAAKDTEIGTWSDWSVAVHATPWIVNPVPSTPTTEVDSVPGTLQPQFKCATFIPF